MGLVACTKCGDPFELNRLQGPLTREQERRPVCTECDRSQAVDPLYKPPANVVLRAIDALRVAHVACEDCGASAFGNLFCLRCLRWQKRMWRERFDQPSDFLRSLIKVAARGLAKEVYKAES